ncbi:MAG: hypothetical protein NVS1B11_35030 [Terriglobales bacterium]
MVRRVSKAIRGTSKKAEGNNSKGVSRAVKRMANKAVRREASKAEVSRAVDNRAIVRVYGCRVPFSPAPNFLLEQTIIIVRRK